jgi:pyoverdine/dityrosine biosynthesis protein Dit1
VLRANDPDTNSKHFSISWGNFMNNEFFDMLRVKHLRTHSGKQYLPYFSKDDLWTGWKIPLEVPGVV